jgi:ABC-type branched-subunit amino acid transport system substrate-binding protein
VGWLGICALWLALQAGLAQAKDDLVIGQTLSLSGPSAALGQALRDGREACVQAINRQAGVQGRHLRLATVDDAGDPQRAATGLRALLEREHPVALLGPMGAAITQRVLPIAQAERLAVIGPQGGEVGLRTSTMAGNAFFLTANQSVEAERLARHIETLGLRQLVVLKSGDSGGEAARAAFEEALSLVGLPASQTLNLAADGRDAAQAVRLALQAEPQAMLLATTGTATDQVLRALAAAHPKGHLLHVYGMSASASPAQLAALGEAAQGYSMTQVVPSPNDRLLPLAVQFRQAMAASGHNATVSELEGCMAVLTLATALRNRPLAEPTPATVLQALRNSGKLRVGGFDIDLADPARGVLYVDLVMIDAQGRMLH